MSNKTQLQTNNSSLDALITRVNAAKDVAASLPEAGSGSIEMVTFSIVEDGPYTSWSGEIAYLNQNGQPQYLYTSPCQVMKNSLVTVYLGSSTLEGNVTKVVDGVYFITGDFYAIADL